MEKRTMRHTYEIHAILQAIYCINETEIKNADITNLLEYIFYRVYKESATTLKNDCRGKTKQEIMHDLLAVLKSETKLL